MPRHHRVTRRTALRIGAAAAALPLVHIRTGHAAGKVSIGFWDHWVPAANDVMKQQCAAFSQAHQVEVQADFITSVGSKNLLTIAAEGAGQDRPRRAAVPRLGGAEPRRPARADRRRDEAADRQVRADQRGERVSVQGQGPLAGGADQRRHAEQGTVRADLDPEGGGGHRRGEDVSAVGGRHAGGRELDLRRDAEGGRGLPQGRQDFRHRPGRHRQLRRYRRRAVRGLRRRSDQRQGRHHSEVGRSARGAGIRPEAGEVPARRCGQLRRCVQQPRADLRAERADLESAIRLGGGEA